MARLSEELDKQTAKEEQLAAVKDEERIKGKGAELKERSRPFRCPENKTEFEKIQAEHELKT